MKEDWSEYDEWRKDLEEEEIINKMYDDYIQYLIDSGEWDPEKWTLTQMS